MMKFDFTEIPVIDNIDDTPISQVRLLIKHGVFYLKVSDNFFYENFDNLRSQALDLFASESVVKNSYKVSKSNDPLTRILAEGYLDRKTNISHFETFRQDMRLTAKPPFETLKKEMDIVKKVLIDELAIQSLKKIVATFSIEENIKSTREIFDNLDCWLQFSYYPSRTFYQRLNFTPGLHPHKDLALITIIMLEKPGLQFWANGKWEDILPKKGYAVALLGNDLATITNENVHVCLHAVNMKENEERLSAVFFVALNPHQPVFSINGDNLFETGIAYRKHKSKLDMGYKSSVNQLFFTFSTRANITCFSFLSMAIANHLFKNTLNTDQVINLFSFIAVSFILINSSIYTFKMTYFERMFMDYLQYPVCPHNISDVEISTYNLGRSSLSFFGILNSFSTVTSYSHRSFWNAGFIRSLVGK